MEKLMQEVAYSILKEYDRASEEYGPIHNSDHEAYAVLLEELEEAKNDVRFCSSAMESLWSAVKNKHCIDSVKIDKLKLIHECAMLGACELIQTAAMAHKAIRTIEERGKR